MGGLQRKLLLRMGPRIYPSGIDTVYANSPGSLRIPLPVIVLARNPLTAHYSMATVEFMPCQANGVCD